MLVGCIGVGLLGLGVVSGQVASVLTEKSAVLAEKVGARPFKDCQAMYEELKPDIVSVCTREYIFNYVCALTSIF